MPEGETSMIKDYGERTCPVCKALFEATYPGHVCCSDKCKRERRLVLGRGRNVLYRLRRKEELESLRARVAELEAEVSRLREAERGSEELKAELERVETELACSKADLTVMREKLEALQGEATSKTELQLPQLDISNWDFCPRMKLRANRLPCGEREECEGCERITERKRVLESGDRICPVCGDVFTPKLPVQKYCSKACRQEAIRAKLKK